jgi:hypothetical protein
MKERICTIDEVEHIIGEEILLDPSGYKNSSCGDKAKALWSIRRIGARRRPCDLLAGGLVRSLSLSWFAAV